MSIPTVWFRLPSFLLCSVLLASVPSGAVHAAESDAAKTTSARSPAAAGDTIEDEPVPKVDAEEPTQGAPDSSSGLPQLDVDEMLEMELKDLLAIQVWSASKKAESVLEAPLSIAVITAEDIARTGARSIPEALRLAPGVIVREQTAGNYDIHIRGFDAVPPNSYIHKSNATTILVMIDNRVVYNYFSGGTYWETLPVSIADVDRIEIVRGPAAALYGPNGATGVVNIVTRTLREQGLSVAANAEHALSANQKSVNGSLGYRFGSHALTLSGNFQELDRHKVEYYSMAEDKWTDDPATLRRPVTATPIDDADAKFPEPKLGVRRVGSNLFATYDGDELRLALSIGAQKSRAQKIIFEDQATLHATYDSTTYHADLRARLADLSVQISFLTGYQEAPTGRSDAGRPGAPELDNYAADSRVLDALAEYDFKPKEGLSLRPLVAFRSTAYSGPVVWKTDASGKMIRAAKSISHVAPGFRTECSFLGAWRVVAAVRVETYFNRKESAYYPRVGLSTDPTAPLPRPQSKQGRRVYPEGQLVLTWMPSDDVFLRGGYHRAYRTPFVSDAFYHKDVPAPLRFRGNAAIDLLTVDAWELGLRAKLLREISVDSDIFYSRYRNDSELIIKNAFPARGSIVLQYDNIPTRAAQLGMTISLSLRLAGIGFRAHATFQQTRIHDHPHRFMEIYEFDRNIYDTSEHVGDVVHKYTPAAYGGLMVDYAPIIG